MKLDKLNIEYWNHKRKKLFKDIDCSIINNIHFEETKQTFMSLSLKFDEDYNYNIEIWLKDSDDNKYRFNSFNKLIKELSNWKNQSNLTPSQKIFRYASITISIQEVNGADLYQLGESGVSDIFDYDYYWNGHEEDKIATINN